MSGELFTGLLESKKHFTPSTSKPLMVARRLHKTSAPAWKMRILATSSSQAEMTLHQGSSELPFTFKVLHKFLKIMLLYFLKKNKKNILH
jgi:hypothetical protein